MGYKCKSGIAGRTDAAVNLGLCKFATFCPFRQCFPRSQFTLQKLLDCPEKMAMAQGAVIHWHYFESHEGEFFSKEEADLGKL